MQEIGKRPTVPLLRWLNASDKACGIQDSRHGVPQEWEQWRATSAVAGFWVLIPSGAPPILLAGLFLVLRSVLVLEEPVQFV